MFEQLVEVICNYVEVEPENVKRESRFMEDLGFTSFDFMSMLGELEDEFDVTIPTVEIIPSNFNSVDAIAAMVERLQEEG